MRHAITVVPTKKELAIQFGEGKMDVTGDLLKISLPENVGLAGMMGNCILCNR